jgi:hypothetical protein
MGKPKSGQAGKEPYVKPELRKYGNLKNITSEVKMGSSGVKRADV